ncbi:MAG TPA: hypothetical protein VM100_00205, partial [Longimicrobiales bacterium]|nr:hypothetical protein [Longimicrobiales bacterium]
MKIRYVLLALLVLPLRLAAQNAPAPDALRVYLDCSYYCDNNFVRTEINYLNWVRDQADAQVHVIVSRQTTGGGGAQYTFTFTGRREFLGREDTLRYTARTTDSEDVVRRGITQILKIGLVPFLALTPSAERLRISWAAPAEAKKAEDGAPKKDPWNFWVFTISSHSNFNGEESQSFGYYSGNVSANRTTDALKLRLGIYGDYRESSFTYDPGSGTDTTVTSISKSYSFNTLLVKSMGSHWSAGVQTEVESATFGNVTLGLSGGPAIEYSIWPYSEATRRSLTFRYSAGFRSFEYRELTIYDKLNETHP